MLILERLYCPGLGGVEENFIMRLDDEYIVAKPEEDLDRTNAAGKASSVQFVHFNFTIPQITKFKDEETIITVGINHIKYGHMAVLSPDTRGRISVGLYLISSLP